jgi:class 3 adenylate cyclase
MGALTFQYNPNLAAVDMKDQIPMSTLVLIITLITVLICFILTVIVTFSLERERKTLFKRLDSEYEKLQVETDKSDKLLLNILPPHVTDRIKGGEQVCDKFTSTIIFSDICGFTSMSHSMHPEEIVEMLNELFTDFDEALSIYGIEKIKTIGDAYMAVAGLNNEDDHAQRCLEFGIQMIHSVKMYNARKNRNLRIRIGLNSGDVVAGVIGSKKFT